MYFCPIQICYRVQDYYFVSKCPEWITKNPEHTVFKDHLPVKLTVRDTIKTLWRVEEPWIDLRKKRPDYNYHFSVIRLRVVRDPFFFLFMDRLVCLLVRRALPSSRHCGEEVRTLTRRGFYGVTHTTPVDEWRWKMPCLASKGPDGC